MGILLYDKNADFSANALGHAGLYTSVTDNLLGLFELRRSASKASQNNAPGNDEAAFIVSGLTFSATGTQFSAPSQIIFPTRPSNGGENTIAAILTIKGGGSGGDTVIASAPATSGADGFLQLSTYTAGVVIYTRDSASQSSMSGSTLKSAAASGLVSHVGENLLVVGTVKSEGAIKLYIPKLSIVVTTSLAGRFIYFNTLAGDNKFMAPGSAALSQPQNASMFAHWDRELSAVEVDTFYLEMKKQFSLLGLAI